MSNVWLTLNEVETTTHRRVALVTSLCFFECQTLLRRLDFSLNCRTNGGIDIDVLRRVVLDPAAQSLVGTIYTPETGRLGEALPDVSGIEQEGILDRPAGSSVATVFPPN